MRPPNPEKIQLLERALSRCRSEEGSVRARLTAELAVELFFTSEPRRHATMREARACVGAIADPHERAQTRVRLIKATPLSAQDRVAWLEAQRQIDGDRESILETADPRVHLDLLQIDYLTALALGDADRW